MTIDEPLTVLMPVRNGGRTIGSAVGDLLASLGPQDEFLVIDDGSEDDTGKVLSGLVNTEERIRVITTQGVGLVDALNLGLREAQFRWIARADADDRYPVDRLSMQRASRRNDVVLITGDYTMTSAGRSLGTIPCALTHPFVLTSLLHPQRVPHPGVLFDREAVFSVGGYRQQDFPAEDLALWLRLARAGQMVGVPHRTVNWAMSSGSTSHQRQQTQRSKTVSLLQSDFPLSYVPRISSELVAAEVSAYRASTMASRREILLARDLRSLGSLKGDSEGYESVRRSLLRRPMRPALAAFGMAAEKTRRDRLRHSWSHPATRKMG